MAVNCCPITVTGYCLTDGSPIAIVFNNGAQTGWILLSTSIFTAGPPPAGTIICIPEVVVESTINVEFNPLTCETDSITVCPPVSGTFDVNVVNELVSRFLECETDSITVCPPVSGTFDVNVINEIESRFLECETDSITICPPVSGTFDVNVINEIESRFLECETDSITICPPVSGTFDVNVVGGSGLTDAELRASPLSTNVLNDTAVNKFATEVRTTRAFTVSAAGDNILITPAVGAKLRVFWVGYSSSESNTAEVLTKLRFGAGADIYRWFMGAPGAFMHWEPIDGGINEDLIIELSGAQTVQVNVTYLEI